MKRVVDIAVSTFGLIAASPVLLPVLLLIWRQDRHSPFYIAPRIGRKGRSFSMVKLRSMVRNADLTGVTSTASQDPRITPVGQLIRTYKIDEVAQLWNVLKGDMSLVGPRPNVKAETELYTDEETKLLSVRPGITDFASIVYSDEGEILAGSADPDLAYNQLIRPGKSRLGIFYVENRSVRVDLELMVLTALAVFSRRVALAGVVAILKRLGAASPLVELAKRDRVLTPMPPPGSPTIVTSR